MRADEPIALPPRNRFRLPRRAFGLAEALMASTVLAVCVIAVAAQLGAAHQQASAVRQQNQAVLLARQLLEEIAAKPLCDRGTTAHLGPEFGEDTRSKFDSADDYHLYADDPQSIRDLTGQPVPIDGDVHFRREVTVQYRTGPSGPAAQAGDYALVIVRVKSAGGQIVQISRLLTKHRVTF